MPEKKPLFTTSEWVSWFGATSVAMAGGMIFIFNTFETKANAISTSELLAREKEIQRSLILQRLDRMENKIDALLETVRVRK